MLDSAPVGEKHAALDNAPVGEKHAVLDNAPVGISSECVVCGGVPLSGISGAQDARDRLSGGQEAGPSHERRIPLKGTPPQPPAFTQNQYRARLDRCRASSQYNREAPALLQPK